METRAKRAGHVWRLAVYAAGLALVLGSIRAPIPARAAGTITVDRTDDTAAAAACTAAPNDCSLRGAFAFANANGGATINVPAATYTLTADELQLGTTAGHSSSVVGAGAATTIIQQTLANRRVIDVNPNYLANVVVSISGVTLTGGNSPSDNFGGGGIIGGGPGNTLSLSNCIITGNDNNAGSTPKGGGVEFAGGGVLNIDGCTISNNSAGTSANGRGVGGGVDFQLLNNAGAAGQGGLSITNSVFSNNKAGASNTGAGGAVHVAATTTQAPSMLTISKNTFAGNQANAASNAFGGAIADGSSNPVTAQFNRFFGNIASGSATGIYKVTGSTGSVNATENWWGCNAGPGSAGCDSIGGDTAKITTTPRLVLALSATPSTILTGQSSALAASFQTDSAGAAVSPGNLGALNGVPVAWSAVGGSVSGAQTTIQPNGTATATFAADATGGNDSASAQVDNQAVTTAIEVDQPPSVTTQPANQLVCAGGAASFSAAASGFPTPTVQWQESANGTTFGDIGGATTTTLSFTPTAGQDGHLFRAVFTNKAGSAATSAATLSINTPPLVSTDPVSRTVGASQLATFTAAASGKPAPSVQWQLSTNGGASWADIPGATAATLSITAATLDDGNQYRAVFTNGCGAATTAAATLTVTSSPTWYVYLPIVRVS